MSMLLKKYQSAPRPDAQRLNTRLLKRLLALFCGCLLAGSSVWCIAPVQKILAETNPVEFQYDPTPYEKEPEDYTDEDTSPSGTLCYRVGDPAAGYITGDTEQTLDEGQLSSAVEAFANLGYRFSMWSDGVKTPRREGDAITTGVLYALFDYVGLPTISLTFEEPEDGLTKEEYVQGSLSVSDVPERFALEDTALKLRARGNSSFRMDKQSYKLHFGEKLSFLGLGAKAKNWLLIANHGDKSLLRNYFAYTLQQRMNGIGYSFPCAMVQVYVNGEYRGVYLACGQIEAAEGRVPISDVGGKDDIGFLVELDHYFTRYEEEPHVLVGEKELPFVIKSAVRTEGQLRYLQEYLTACDEAIRAGDREQIEALMDLPSLIDSYILEEFTKNIDVGWSSFYLYLPAGAASGDGKLTVGPCWDFDLSSGNDRRLDKGNFTGLYVGRRRSNAQQHPWYYLLMAQDWFREAVIDRFDTLLPVIRKTIIEVEDFADLNFEQLEANFDAWPVLDKRVYKEPAEVLRRTDYASQLQYLFDWYKSRLDWLDSYFHPAEDLSSDETS